MARPRKTAPTANKFRRNYKRPENRIANRNQAEFLAIFAECGSVSKAAEQVGIARTRHYEWLESSPGYAEKFREANQIAIEKLEHEARRRAVEGIEEPVFYLGKKCGTVRKFSDTLLIFLLKAARPETYRENQRIQLDGNLHHSGNVQIYLPNNGRDPS